MEKKTYNRKIANNRLSLGIEILLTLSIAVTVIVIGLSNLSNEAGQFSQEMESDYDMLFDHYSTTFYMITGQVEKKIQEDLSYEEMNLWLQSMDDVFRQQIGEDVYDAISLTYKGGYARSWDYGDYTDYDPGTRPWYQQAQKADGKTAIVAPYVTYLDPSYLNDDEYILMTITQKYNDEISFDYDLKIGGIQKLLEKRKFQYKDSQVLFYDKEGYILSSNIKEQFAHNILTPDTVISKNLSENVAKDKKRLGHLDFAIVDGNWKLMYSMKDESENTLCILYPFWEVILRNFLMTGLSALLLICFEIFMYSKNKKTILGYQRRDQRLSRISDAAYEQQLYVDLSSMEFYGNKKAKEWVKSNDYLTLYPNLLAAMEDDVAKKQFSDFLSPDALKEASNELESIKSKKFNVVREISGKKEPFVYKVSRILYEMEGSIVASILVNDVTQDANILRDALQKAEAASDAKGSFMSRMSHEIRTPLNAIIGYLEIAQDEHEDDEKVMHCLEKSELASKHLLSIINDVLDISSIESGRMKLAKEDFDMKQMVNSLTTLFYAQAKEKGIDFEVYVDSLTYEWLSGDELRMRQILLNLLSNAVKFTDRGGRITLNIRQVGIVREKIHLQFEVTDTGIGMSEEYLSRMFQPFEQENASTARNYGGTGLGLSISFNLVQMMGGNIRVKSTQGEGTTFTVFLAFSKAETRQSEHLATESFVNVKALVVDDEEDTCEYVKKLLERCGVKCDTVTSGKKALRRIKTRLDSDHPYDLCIVDWSMEGMDGLETAREIRKLCGQEIPIIIATAYDYSSIVEEAKKAGVDKIISKPLFQSTMFNLLVNTYGKYKPVEAKKKKKVDFGGLKIILAEDNEMNMEIAMDILKKTGLAITPVVNGKEAVDVFTQSEPGTYDAILMDIQMPVMDGYEASRAIRESNHPKAREIPIIAMTANAFTEDVTAALAAGMNDHVAKPVDYEKLFDAISRLTQNHNK